jgi:hypothetical protein
MDIHSSIHRQVGSFQRRGFNKQSKMQHCVISYRTLSMLLVAPPTFLTAAVLLQQQVRAQGITTGGISGAVTGPLFGQLKTGSISGTVRGIAGSQICRIGIPRIAQP